MSPNAIEVVGLSKSYGKVVALEDVSLEVREGELVSLLGPNGAGKTTLVRHLYCELRPEKGFVRVLGVDPCNREVRLRMGVTPQEAQPYGDLTVFDNVYYAARVRGVPRDKAREMALETIRRLGLWEHRNRYVMDLSGGQRRRTLVAMAVVHSPEVLVLDEPTTGLDPMGRREFWDVLRQLKGEGRAILLTTHYMEEAEALSDRVYFINRKVLAEGTPAELRKRFAFYYEVIDLEEGKVYKVREDEVKEFVAKLRGKFEVRAPSLEEVYLEVMKGA
ncbi:MAG: ABC-type multidrug transport system, ATPase component [uncultured Acidilobus sp. OSP8]|jgi:ABC-type multidrug transport system, ATPase component|nr:MAG: ABC-type multidrug transport system, ATPase component [uncultured Acidilobus sp. OSP8]